MDKMNMLSTMIIMCLFYNIAVLLDVYYNTPSGLMKLWAVSILCVGFKNFMHTFYQISTHDE